MLFINALVSKVDCQQGVDCQRSSPRSLQPAEWNGSHSRVPVLATIDRGWGSGAKSLATHGRKIDGVMSARPTMSADCSDGKRKISTRSRRSKKARNGMLPSVLAQRPLCAIDLRKDGPGGNEHRAITGPITKPFSPKVAMPPRVVINTT